MTALNLQDDMAALLQARMSWPAAAGCAADLVMMFGRRMRDCPLTCQFCTHAPATHLLAADLKTGRFLKLVCGTCGNAGIADARKIAKTAPSAWLFTLVPAGSD